MTSAWRRPATYLAVVVVLLLAWEMLTVTGLVKPILLAPPLDVWNRLLFIAQKPAAVFGPVGVTLAEVGVALVVAIIVGVPIGIAVGSSQLLRKAYTPLLTTLNALPLVILYPVLAASLGIGSESKIVLGALYGFFPIAIATAQAAGHVDRRLIIASEVMGASRAQVIRSVVLPAIVQPIIAGIRVSLALTTVTVIAAEFISGENGVGYELAASSQGLDTPTLFAWVVVACVLTIVVNAVFSVGTNAIERGIKR